MIQARAVQASGVRPAVQCGEQNLTDREKPQCMVPARSCTMRRCSLAAKNHVPVKFDRDLSRSRFAGALSAAELHRCPLTYCGSRRNMSRREFESTNSNPRIRIKEEAFAVKSLRRACGGGIPAGTTTGGHTVRAPFMTSEAARSRGETLHGPRGSPALPMSSTV